LDSRKKEKSIQSSFNEFNLVWPNIHFQKIWFLIFSHPKDETEEVSFYIFRLRAKIENAKMQSWYSDKKLIKMKKYKLS
jgi:hypothetical protein